MKFSLSWLKEYIPLEMGLEGLTDGLTMAGLEVDSVTPLYDSLDGVVVARIVEAKPHPNADKLRLCQVDVGADEPVGIVCGAPNAAEGLVVPCALPGAVLPGGVKIKKGKIRGEKSGGMLCSARELQLDTDASGLMELGTDLEPGTPLKEALDLFDSMVEIDLTPNRPDCLSVLGVAREAGSLQEPPVVLTRPAVSLPEADASLGTIGDHTSVTIEDADLCWRYAARLVFDVKVGPSPAWLQRRLLSVGLTPINNIVDITNFVMMETGQPLHAFDFDRLAENRIVVKRASEGEAFTTLDEKEHKLNAEMLMICDGEKSVAIGGVMGGMNSEIEEGTTRVLLESACFNPTSVRKTSKLTGIHSDASHRFERGTDPEGVVYALDRATALMAELGNGRLVEGLIDENPVPYAPRTITVDVDALNRRLGTSLSADDMAGYLARVEFTVTVSDANTLEVVPPSFRVDVERPEDISEEIARLWGYNNIETSYAKVVAAKESYPPAFEARQAVRGAFVGLGFNEAVNYSFIREDAVDRLRFAEADPRRRLVTILNPISEEQKVMRTSLVPGLLSSAARNISVQERSLRLFEVGATFIAGEGETLPQEPEMLAGLVTGDRRAASWFGKEESCDFFDLKGALEGFFEALHVSGVAFRPMAADDCSYTRQGYTAEILLDGEAIGLAGKVHGDVLKSFELKQDVFVFEMAMAPLAERISGDRQATAIPKFPSVTRDVTIICEASVRSGDAVASILDEKQPLIERAWLLDRYAGENIPEGKQSLTFRVVYRSADKTLNDKAVNKIHNRIMEMLLKRFDAVLP
ncbi:phenylalanine--tRNA ligase subunit beta [Desulfoluna butyratoxydans]|uniref:Phenylalanine--tRNA ligase beta subunit n=1 Tax=Desulfoluna butyratoxydans TaxID=231438 RepID=A0A4U8YJN6_9BACT|nr:phenylalanine--tRNA ligase subunit beta [Desulfoluna butyratoxydans]VFQ43985.1 phenylalanine-trna ligase class iic beta subunit [Desulfoluna butyratoxydans]